jgi:hypothetical protein
VSLGRPFFEVGKLLSHDVNIVVEALLVLASMGMQFPYFRLPNAN